MKKVSWQASVFQAAGGAIAAGAIIRFLLPGDVLADVWSDRDGNNPINNPITTDETGFALAYLTPAVYKVEVTVDSITRTLNDVLLPNEGSRGVVEWFEIGVTPFPLLPEHTGMTGFITLDDAEITVPLWAVAEDGYGVELIPNTGVSALLVLQGADTMRDDRLLITGDAALTRTPSTDLWLTVGATEVPPP